MVPGVGTAVLVGLLIAVAEIAPPSSMEVAPLPPGGIIIPLYVNPGPTWNAVIQARLENPNLPFIVIVNPSNGPGNSSQPDFMEGINEMKSAGILVFGYVYTDYGRANPTAIENQVSDYKAWYGVSGILFDEMPSTPGYEMYYFTISNYSRSLGLYTIGNPGVQLPESYKGIMDLYVLDEGTSPPVSFGAYPPSVSASVIFGVRSITPCYVASVAAVSGYVYVTDRGSPNPYDGLPSYFSSLVSILSGNNANQTTTTSCQTATTATGQTPGSGPAAEATPMRAIVFILGCTAIAADAVVYLFRSRWRGGGRGSVAEAGVSS
jgi:Spherulation-specific family 4